MKRKDRETPHLLRQKNNGRPRAEEGAVDRHVIKCASCGQSWLAAISFSVYEQQAVESCPCPHCGAYTLCFAEPARQGDLDRRLAGGTGLPSTLRR
jgi:hypothetical protein